MSNPQLEKGFTRIANELIQALYRVNLNGSEFRIILFIIYQTYGYNKKSRQLSYTYISKGTGIPYGSVRRSIKHLFECGIINQKSSNDNSIIELSVDKNYTQWMSKNEHPLSKNEQSKMNTPCSKMSAQKWTEGVSKNERYPCSKMDTNTRQNKTRQIKTIQSSSTTTSETAPKFDEVISYCDKKGYTFDSNKFFYHYQSLGWKYKGQSIADWKALADRWQVTENQFLYNAKAETKTSYDIEEFENYSMFDE